MDYEVLPYTAENLAIALSGNDSGTGHYVQSISIEAIKQKNHYKYFLSYFSDEGIGARTIVIEKKYDGAEHRYVCKTGQQLFQRCLCREVS